MDSRQDLPIEHDKSEYTPSNVEEPITYGAPEQSQEINNGMIPRRRRGTGPKREGCRRVRRRLRCVGLKQMQCVDIGVQECVGGEIRARRVKREIKVCGAARDIQGAVGQSEGVCVDDIAEVELLERISIVKQDGRFAGVYWLENQGDGIGDVRGFGRHDQNLERTGRAVVQAEIGLEGAEIGVQGVVDGYEVGIAGDDLIDVFPHSILRRQNSGRLEIVDEGDRKEDYHDNSEENRPSHVVPLPSPRFVDHVGSISSPVTAGRIRAIPRRGNRADLSPLGQS